IASGANCTVTITFQPQNPPASHNGETLAITSNDPDEPIVDVTLNGNGLALSVPEIQVNPTTLNFPATIVGNSSSSQTVTISNLGTADLIISDIVISDSTNYLLNLSGGSNPCGSASFNLAAGNNCTVSISFTPASPAGSHDGEILTINSNDSDEPAVPVTLNGQGINAPASDPNLTITPSSHNFGNIIIGNTLSNVFTLSNIGADNLNISNLYLESANQYVLNLNGGGNPCANTALTLPAGQSCTVEVSFTAETPGNQTNTLLADSNDPDTPNYPVPLAANQIQEFICGFLNLVERKDNLLNFEACILEEEEETSDKIDEDEDGGTGLEKIKLRADADNMIQGLFEVKYYQDKPSKLELPDAFTDYAIYKYLKITPDFSNDRVDKATFYLRVEKQWLEQNKILNLVFLQTDDDNETETLEVELDEDDEDEDYNVYKVTSDNLTRYLTIAGEKPELKPIIYASFLEHRFDQTSVGEESPLETLVLSNRGNADLDISEIFIQDFDNFFIDRTDCNNQEVIEPEQSCEVLLKFTPKQAGDYTTDISVKSNDPERPELIINLSGSSPEIIPTPEPKNPKIYLSFLKHRFETTQINQNSPTQILTVYNRGDADLDIYSINPDRSSSSFIVNKNPQEDPCGSKPTLEPEQSCNLAITFKPRKVGELASMINFQSNDPDRPNLNVDLNGAALEEKTKTPILETRELGNQEFEQIQVNQETVETRGALFPISTLSKIIAAVVAGFSIAQIGSGLNSFLQFFNLLGIPFYRRKKTKQGVVYDALTGQPVPFAEVIIYGEDGKAKEIKTADRYGSYFFLVPAGKYTLTVNKKNYRMLPKSDESLIKVSYEPVYYQNQILKYEDQGQVNIAIPMVQRDNAKFSVFNSQNFQKLMEYFFWIGFAFSTVAVILYPTIWNFFVIGLYIVIWFLRFLGIYKPKWGIVLNTQGVPQSLVFVHVYEQESDQMLGRAISDSTGRYTFILNKGAYRLEAKDNKAKKTAEQLFRLKHRDAVAEKIVIK
ncbi:MAG: choice-of-anchor D domain-containing protein, partial [Candidatus Moranbacteria bacterium]|nr:choice-of-anchor D domain-containing protein [Candidatus Moranbacteria bacterium]